MIAAAGVLIITGATAIVVITRHRAEAERVVPEVVRQVQTRTVGRLQSVPAVPLRDPAAVVAPFQAGEFADEIDPELRSTIAAGRFRELLGEYLSLLAGADAEAYADWMRDRGYKAGVFASNPESWESSVKLWAGGTRPVPQNIDELWARLFEYQLRHKGGLGTLDGALVSPQSAMIVMMTLGPGQSVAEVPLRLRDENGDRRLLEWFGLGMSEPAPVPFAFWVPPRSFDEVLDTQGSVIAAAATVGVENTKSERFPFYIEAFYEQRTQRWWIVSVNPGGPEGNRGEYFFF